MALLKETNDPCTSVIVHPFILITAAAQRAETSHARADCKYHTTKYLGIRIFYLIDSQHGGKPPGFPWGSNGAADTVVASLIRASV